MRIRTELALPHRVAQDYHGPAAGHLLRCRKAAAKHGPRPERREQLGTAGDCDRLRVTPATVQHDAVDSVVGQRLQRVAARLPRKNVGQKRPCRSALRIGGRQRKEVRRVRIAERLQQRGAHHGEHGRVRTNPERQNNDHTQCKPGSAAKRTHSEAKVFPECVHRRHPSCVAGRLLIAQYLHRLCRCGAAGRHPGSATG